MKTSFVIVNYNRREELLITISKTKQYINGRDNEFEIVVVDNGSVDQSAAAVKEKYPEVTLIENIVNTGAPAWNLGFEAAKGDYFVIIDDDSHVESGLEEAVAYMDRNPKVGVLALNVTTGPYTSEIYQWQDEQQVVGFIGCGALLRKETYKKIGGYADWIFLYGNEWEYGLRSLNAGYEIRYFAGCKVTHRASPINRTNKRLKVFCTRNEMAFIYKYFGDQKWKYLNRMFFNGLKALKNEGVKPAYYTILGAIEFLKMRKSIVKTPVSTQARTFFADSFRGTLPVFGFLHKKLNTKHIN
jgi:GT2 family glycosyltransferase